MASLDRIAAHLRRHPAQRQEVPADMHRAAVALIVRPDGDLLFIRRAQRRGDPWSGHMAFPGGRMEPADADVRVTAERETLEEVGLDLIAHGQLIGRLDELSTPLMAGPRRFVVTPFLYRIDVDPVLSPNNEVAAIHWLSCERLLAGDGRGVHPVVWRGVPFEMPAIALDGADIWGLTLRVLDGLLERARDSGA